MQDKKNNNIENSTKSFLLHKIIYVFFCIFIIIAGAALALYFKNTEPKAVRKKQPKMIPLVKVKTMKPINEKIIVRASGTVIPAKKIVLKSRVSGEIIYTNPDFIEGGIINMGDDIIRLDKQDYELAVIRKKSQVTNLLYTFKLEKGHQDVARREWKILNKNFRDSDADLALRKPHMGKARADVAAAEADLKQARLNLDRTTIKSPFNAIVISKNIDLGSQVSTQENLAELVCIDEYYIQVSIPVDRLKWIFIPRHENDNASKVTIKYRNGLKRYGKVIKLLGDLETKGHMARILVSVNDPLCLNNKDISRSPFLIGEYVKVEIEGLELNDIYRIPRSAYRDNSHIWIAGKDELLYIRKINTVWRDSQYVLAKSGINPLEQLIVSDLSAPINKMAIKIFH